MTEESLENQGCLRASEAVGRKSGYLLSILKIRS